MAYEVDEVNKVRALNVIKDPSFSKYYINFEVEDPSAPVFAEVDGLELGDVLSVRGDESGTKVNFGGLVSCRVEKRGNKEILKCVRKSEREERRTIFE
jgi:hypothetical protein